MLWSAMLQNDIVNFSSLNKHNNFISISFGQTSR